MLAELDAENVAAWWRDGWSGGWEEEEDGPVSVENRRTRPPNRPKREAECGEGDVGVAAPEEVGDAATGEGIFGRSDGIGDDRLGWSDGELV